jgi:hypothetical protein
MAITISERAKELLRNQVPYAGTDLPSSPILALFEELVGVVNQLDGEVPRVLSVSLEAADTELEVGTGATDADEVVTATVVAQGGAAEDVTWSSSDEGVATVAAGTVTAVGVGTTVITATSDYSPSVSGSITFTVINVD